MKLLAVLLIVGVASAITMEDRFDSFMTTYQRRYYGAEYQYRLKVFAENVKLAEQRNLEDSAVHGVTQFSDLTVEEFRQKFLMKAEEGQKLAVACLQHGIYKKSTKGLVPPDSWDWRDHAGVVQPIGDQKSCGSCWAFSAAANIEGVLGVAGRNVGKMSPQYIVDCSKGCTSLIYYGKNTTVCNAGCQGGWPWTAYMDIIDQGGIPTETDYPYQGHDQTCKGNNFPDVVHLRNYTCLSGPAADDEVDMMNQVILYGPLSVALEADYFQSYKNGVLDPASCPTAYLNHAVTLIGYGHDSSVNKDYWLIKNSWGTSWGENGYVRLRRGVNRCGITEAVSTAVLE